MMCLLCKELGFARLLGLHPYSRSRPLFARIPLFLERCEEYAQARRISIYIVNLASPASDPATSWPKTCTEYLCPAFQTYASFKCHPTNAPNEYATRRNSCSPIVAHLIHTLGLAATPGYYLVGP